MPTRKIIFRQGQAPGDVLTMTRPLYDVKRAYPDWEIDVDTAVPELFENSPHLTPLNKDDPGVEYYDIHYDDLHESGWRGLHFSDAFRNDIARKINQRRLLFTIPASITYTYARAGKGKVFHLVSCPRIQSVEEERLTFYRNQERVLATGLDPCKTCNPLEAPIIVRKEMPLILEEGRLPEPILGEFERHNISLSTPYMGKVKDEDDWLIGDGYLMKQTGKSLEIHSPDPVDRWGYCEVPTTGLAPELFISDEEKSWYNQVHCSFYWDGPFWLINAGRKADNVLKQYHRWQEVVDRLNDYWRGRVRIVQIGHKGSEDMAHIHPPLKGVFNLVGQTDTRQLIRLAYSSTGIIGPISFQFVLAAAFEKPCVVAAGGKEGTRWHIYNHVQWVKKNGCLPCAMSDGCWKGGTTGKCLNLVVPHDMDEEVPLCFEMTRPDELAWATRDYYEGTRLQIPDTEQWHVPEGWDVEAIKGKFEPYYESGEFPEKEVYDELQGSV